MKNNAFISILCSTIFGYCNDNIKDYSIGAIHAFIGIHTGGSFMEANIYYGGDNIGWQNGANIPFSISGAKVEARLNLGLNVGIEYFFNSYIGLKGHVKYDYSGFRNIIDIARIATEDITANIDLLVNVARFSFISINAFAGLGVGYEILQWSDDNTRARFSDIFAYNGFILPINIGISMDMGWHHRVEITSSMKTINAVIPLKDSNIGLSVTPYILSIGYSYIF